MRIKNILIAICFFIVSIILAALIILSNNTFYLDDEYYGSTKVEEIYTSDLNKLLGLSKTFVLFVYQPMCVNSADFEIVLDEFQKETQISYKKIAFSNLKGTDLEDKIKYYPSFVIIKNGSVVDYLEADNDEDTKAFKNKDDFKEWFTKHVLIKKSRNETKTTTQSTQDIGNIVIDLPEVQKEDGKVNIYFFWGDGCPHCEHEKEFFDSIKEEYGEQYNLYMFETWKNINNANIMKVFSSEMGNGEKGGVPYTVIGSQAFRGFGSSSEEKFKEAIKTEAKKDFDIYIDVIKDKYKG